MNSASSVQRFIRVIELLTWHGRRAWIMDVLSWQQTQQKLTLRLLVGHVDRGLVVAVMDIQIMGDWWLNVEHN